MKLIIGNDFEITLKTARDFVFESDNIKIESTNAGIKFTGASDDCPVRVEGSAHGWDYLSDRFTSCMSQFAVQKIEPESIRERNDIEKETLERIRELNSVYLDQKERHPVLTLQGYEIDARSIEHDGAIGIDFDDPKWGIPIEDKKS